MIFGFSQLKSIFDINAYLPYDFGQEPNGGAPRFFSLEVSLILPSGLFLLGAAIFVGLSVLEWLGILVPVNEKPYWLMMIGVFSLLGLGGFCLIYGLAHRNLTKEQLDWMKTNYSKLGLPEPNDVSSKQDLKVYVERAYELQSKRESYL